MKLLTPKLRWLKFGMIVGLATFFFACQHETSNKQSAITTGEQLADTIIYSVQIRNTDSLDTWTDKCLSKLDNKKLVDQLFESVYNHKAIPYSYSTDQAMSVGDIKSLEESEDFTRDRVGKLQFWESWYYDASQQHMTKKVNAILIAYEIRADDGTIRGYKAAFYIKLNN